MMNTRTLSTLLLALGGLTLATPPTAQAMSPVLASPTSLTLVDDDFEGLPVGAPLSAAGWTQGEPASAYPGTLNISDTTIATGNSARMPPAPDGVYHAPYHHKFIDRGVLGAGESIEMRAVVRTSATHYRIAIQLGTSVTSGQEQGYHCSLLYLFAYAGGSVGGQGLPTVPTSPLPADDTVELRLIVDSAGVGHCAWRALDEQQWNTVGSVPGPIGRIDYAQLAIASSPAAGYNGEGWFDDVKVFHHGLQPTDTDADGVDDDSDNCVDVPNPTQVDGDADGAGDACDPCPADALNDSDSDGICGDVDNCADLANPDQFDADADGSGDVCDDCPLDALDDEDDDGLCAEVDPCPVDALNDADGDGYCESSDNCAEVPNPSQYDADENGVGDLCEGAVCEMVRKACNREHRVEVRACALAHNVCRRHCPRRDATCRDDCRAARGLCEDAAAQSLDDCLTETTCVPRRECKAAARADHRLCRQGGQSAYRSCRQTCVDAADTGACRSACRDSWRATRDACRATRRQVILTVCLEPYDAPAECAASQSACLSAADAEHGVCLADARPAAMCDTERQQDEQSCTAEHTACLAAP